MKAFTRFYMGAKDAEQPAEVARQVNKVQENVASALQQFITNPLLDGILSSSTSVGTSATRIVHKLGRKPLGWLVVQQDANAVVWQTSMDEEAVTVQASSAVNVTFYFF